MHDSVPVSPWLQIKNPARFLWRRFDLPIADLPADLVGLRIVHLSDVHFQRRWYSGHDQLLQRLADDRPDLIVVTGDWVDDKTDHAADVPLVKRLAGGLIARFGAFSILGNHDGDLLGPHLRDTPVRLLVGEQASVPIGEAAIDLIGLPGVHHDDLTDELLDGFAPKPPRSVRMVLAHFPDQIRQVERLRPDIYLAGHTHGGQICLPNGWPPLTHDSLPRRFAKGVHRWNESWMVINRGFGFAGLIPARLFCPGEVIELVLQTKT